ncbi:MAG: D-alanine--D-alanine ligase family protein [Rikenellaceae bacterium]|nr:D-alanine--D-alanine ligase [Alistipes sp.]MDO5487542.1 D-alanine--D-alanine ligase family protein [Rikenellaceae bacterium]
MKTKINVGVIFGGRSVENEISVLTAIQAMEAIDTAKYDITPIYITKQGHWYTGEELRQSQNYKDMERLLEKCEQVYLRPIYGDNHLYRVRKPLFGSDIVATIDVILPALHGTNCEDGSFQGTIEMTGIPYAGCNVLASANGMDKITMKMILAQSGIPVIDYVWFSDKEWFDREAATIERVEQQLGYPVIVKPADSGSSVGIKAVHNREELKEATENAISYSKRIIVEHLVEQLKEINCSVLGNYYECEASVCEAPIRSGEILSYEDKYLGGGAKGAKGGVKESRGMHSTVREIPARLPEQQTEFIRTKAVETFKALACDGVARIDFMIDEKDQQIYVNEINTIPGSLSFYLWEATGVGFDELVERLINIAFERKRDSSFKTTSYKENIFNYSLGGAKGAKGAKR